jgi:RNA polymerase sigma-70 factor, ECF subfamily
MVESSIMFVIGDPYCNVNDKLQSKLVNAAKSGNLECFGTLCKHYYSTLVAIAYSILGDHHLAEDATQAAYAKAITALPKLKDSGKFAPWLGQICRNTAMDMIRKNARQYTTDDLSQVKAADEHDETSPLIRQAIEMLTPAEKEIICLRYYDQMSYQQMGEILDLSSAAINGRLKRAKKKIAEHLKRNDFRRLNHGT